MFRLLNSHLQAYSLQVKSQDAVYTLGPQCVYISGILKPYHLSRRVKSAKCVSNIEMNPTNLFKEFFHPLHVSELECAKIRVKLFIRNYIKCKTIHIQVYRPEETPKFPGVYGSHISRQSA